MEFLRATSANLPTVDVTMVIDFLINSPLYSSAEFRGVKAGKSARSAYGDQAVGFVELRREGSLCYVRGRITPEHKVRVKPYTVSSTINEEESLVVSATCDDCASSQGGCKHAIAFLFWLHRRSEEPSPTSVTSYWKKSSLASVGNKKTFTLKDSSKIKEATIPQPILDLRQEASGLLASWENIDDVEYSTNLYQLKREFLKAGLDGVEAFLIFSSTKIKEVQVAAEELTRSQRNSRLWHQIRYGRLTASVIHAASRCKGEGASLVERILGAYVIDTPAMKRGRDLEDDVIKELERREHIKVRRSGIFVDAHHPHLGASPDGVTDDAVIEVKCPSKATTVSKYIDKNGKIGASFFSQIQLQMLLSQRRTGLFVVADPSFEENRRITVKLVTLDETFCNELIKASFDFWASYVYPFI